MKNEALDKEIVDYVVSSNGRIMPARTNAAVLTKRGYYDYLMQRYSDNVTNSLSEIIYRLVHGIEVAPKCPECGKPVPFRNKGYSTWCSPKCRNNSEEVKKKNKEGVSNSLKRVYAERKDEIQSKRAETLRERYGESNNGTPFSVSSIQDKARKSIKERYGVDNILILPEFRKTRETSRKLSVELWKERGLDIEYNGDTIIVHNACPIHGDAELSLSDFNNRTKPERLATSCLCPICHPINYNSGEEVSMKEFLDSNGIEYVCNDRKIIAPYELDFYIPSKNLAIEMDGVYYHSAEAKPQDYHKKKTELCDKEGIRLIHLWEDDWSMKRDIVISMLKSRFGITDNKIYARKCVIMEVPSKEAREFCNKNHLQGYVNSSYRFGLYYNGELVSIMTFGKSRPFIGSGDGYELYRFCNKLNTQVIGGASKLFAHAKKILKGCGVNEIYTYAKRDWSCGNLYKTLGFEFVGYTVPNYFYGSAVKPRLTRYECMKHKLVGKYGEGTEEEIMKRRGYYKCYDSGNVKFRMEI